MLTALPIAESGIRMAPLDWGITGAAVLMLIFAARSLFGGDGKAQMGCSFAVVAVTLWTFALGRHLPEFSWQDGARLSLGALLLLPAARAIFKHGQASVVTAAVSLVLAAVVAGPVVSRYTDAVESDTSTPAGLVAKIGDEIDSLEDLREGLVRDASARKAALRDKGHASAEDVAGDLESMQLLREWAGFRDQIAQVDERLVTLRSKRDELVASESATEDLAQSELDRIRREVADAADTSDMTALEVYTEQKRLLDLFDQELTQ